jgi:hypothetical protein
VPLGERDAARFFNEGLRGVIVGEAQVERWALRNLPTRGFDNLISPRR